MALRALPVIALYVSILTGSVTWSLSTSAAEKTSPSSHYQPSSQIQAGVAPDGRWGWIVVIASLSVGAALTGYGLSVECRDSDTDCQRHAGLFIWGGVGVASTGSALGIAIVQTTLVRF